MLSKHTDKEIGTWLAAYLAFMYNMIARLDDASKFRLPDLQPFHQFLDYGVTSKLCWTKNCIEERDPPHTNYFWKLELEVLLHLLVDSMA